ncbi:glutathione S-transferase family protein [Chitinivorax sp. B]|uniref:glutathione S-transferase family protein n=1 Tax=Chitinivorax sp. B TaxID=2502235 RepID=UPI0010F969EF|nr:glutathione S-transferase family protein [Chitinivorax sp. B]
MKIYGHVNSRSTRALWAAEEVGASYEYESIDLMGGAARREPYISINPGGKVPALVEGELVLTESAAICNYLANRFPEASLLPKEGSKERALVDRWSYFAMTEMDAPLWTLTKHKMIYPEGKRVPAIIDVAIGEFARSVQLLEKGLGAQEFIVGSRFSVADLLLGHCLSWAKAFQVPIDSDIVMAYAKRLWARPALVRARAREMA